MYLCLLPSDDMLCLSNIITPFTTQLPKHHPLPPPHTHHTKTAMRNAMNICRLNLISFININSGLCYMLYALYALCCIIKVSVCLSFGKLCVCV